MNRAFLLILGVLTKKEQDLSMLSLFPPLLFIEDNSYYDTSVVGYSYNRHSFYPYIKAYEEIGILLEQVSLKDRCYDLFLPMCYLYRNCVELSLKRLLLESSHIEHETAMRIYRKKKHSILGLWNTLYDEIDQPQSIPKGDKLLIYVSNYIDEFHQLDPKSDLFRYPMKKDMTFYFSKKKIYNPRNISSCFQELIRFLEALSTKVRKFETPSC